MKPNQSTSLQTRINWSVITVLDFVSCYYYDCDSLKLFFCAKKRQSLQNDQERARECGTVHVEPFFLLTVIFLTVGFLEIRWPTSAMAKQKVMAKQISNRGTTK